MGTEPRTISKADALAEAYKRGLLPPDKKAAYEEAQRRGLVGGQPAAVAQPAAPQAASPAPVAKPAPDQMPWDMAPNGGQDFARLHTPNPGDKLATTPWKPGEARGIAPTRGFEMAPASPQAMADKVTKPTTVVKPYDWEGPIPEPTGEGRSIQRESQDALVQKWADYLYARRISETQLQRDMAPGMEKSNYVETARPFNIAGMDIKISGNNDKLWQQAQEAAERSGWSGPPRASQWNAAETVLNDLSLGFSDEIGGAIGAAGSYVANLPQGADAAAKAAADTFTRHRDDANFTFNLSRQDRPAEVIGGNVATMLVPAVGSTKIGNALQGASTGNRIIDTSRRIGAQTATGAGLGALYGVGTNHPGNPADLETTTLFGAAAGAGFATLAPVIGASFKKLDSLLDAKSKAFRSLPEPQQREIVESLAAQGLDADAIVNTIRTGRAPTAQAAAAQPSVSPVAQPTAPPVASQGPQPTFTQRSGAAIKADLDRARASGNKEAIAILEAERDSLQFIDPKTGQPRGKTAKTQAAPTGARSKSMFSSGSIYSVSTADNGVFDASLNRTHDGGAVIFHDKGTIPITPEFAKGKSDEELLAYYFEPVGFQGATKGPTTQGAAQAAPQAPPAAAGAAANPQATQRAQQLLDGVDAGGIPSNPILVNRIARDLGLDVADDAPMADTIERVRTELAQQGQPTVTQGPARGAQPGATGAGQQAAGAVPPAGPATLQGVPTQPPISKQQALIDRDTIKITRRIMRSAGIKDADVMGYLPGAVQRFESLNDPRIPLAFFLKSDLPKHFPEEVANRVGTNLDVWGRARNAETGVNDTSRATINKTVTELRKTQQSFLTDSAERNLFKGSLIGQEDQIVASLRETGRKGYEPVLDNARQVVDGRRVPTPDEAAAVDELRGILSDPMMLGYVDDATRIRAKKEGVDLDQLMQQDPIGAAHWLQSEFRRLSDAAEDAVTGKPTRMSQAYDDLRDMVLDPLKRAAPGYEGAMNRYGHLYGAKDAVRFGKGIFTAGRSAYDTAQKVRQFKKLGRRQQTVAWKSIRDEFLNEFRGTPEDAAAKVTRMQSEGALDILEQLGPRGKRFADDIRSIAQVENPNLRAIDQGSGSPTYSNQQGGANAVDMVQSPVNQAIGAFGQKGSLPTTLAGDAVLAFSGLPPVLTLGKGVTWTIDKFGNPSKKVLARATEGLYGLPKGKAPPLPTQRKVSGPRSSAAAALEAEEAEDMAELLRALDVTEKNAKTRGGRKGQAILNKIDAAAKAPPANRLKAPKPPPAKTGGKKPPQSNASPMVTSALIGGAAGAAAAPEDARGIGLVAGLAGGAFLGNRLSKMGGSKPKTVKPPPGARVDAPSNVQRGPWKDTPKPPKPVSERQKAKARLDELRAIGLSGKQARAVDEMSLDSIKSRGQATPDFKRGVEVATLRGQGIADEQIASQLGIRGGKEELDRLEELVGAYDWGHPAMRPEFYANSPEQMSPMEIMEFRQLQAKRQTVTPFRKPPPGAGGKPQPVGAKAAPPPFKPIEGAEVIDTTSWTPTEFNAARKQLNEMMQDRRAMSGPQLAELDMEITSLRNALDPPIAPEFADVPMASRFNAPVDQPWPKGSPADTAIKKAIEGKNWTVQSVPLAKVIPTQDGVFFDYAKAAARYAGDDRLPIVVKQGDQYFVADGHHRLMAQGGAGQVRARVIDLAPSSKGPGGKPPPVQAGTPKPPPAAKPKNALGGIAGRAVAGGAIGGLVGALGGDASAQDDLAAEIMSAEGKISAVEQEIAALKKAKADFDKITDPFEKQRFLKANGLYAGDIDGDIRGMTTVGINRWNEQNARALDKAEEELAAGKKSLDELRKQDAYRQMQKEQNPFFDAVRELGPSGAAILGGIAATVLRMRGVGKSAKAVKQIENDINDLLTNGPVRGLLKKGGAANQPRNRAANMNEFYRRGGAPDDKLPFNYGQSGWKPNPKAAKPGSLYSEKTTTKMDGVGSTLLRPTDIKVIGAGLLDSALVTPFVSGAEEELKKAQADVENGNTSIEALRRVEKAKTDLAMYQAIQRLGWGVAGAGALGAAYRYKLPRPDIRGAEDEVTAIADYLKSVAPPKPKKSKKP